MGGVTETVAVEAAAHGLQLWRLGLLPDGRCQVEDRCERITKGLRPWPNGAGWQMGENAVALLVHGA